MARLQPQQRPQLVNQTQAKKLKMKKKSYTVKSVNTEAQLKEEPIRTQSVQVPSRHALEHQGLGMSGSFFLIAVIGLPNCCQVHCEYHHQEFSRSKFRLLLLET